MKVCSVCKEEKEFIFFKKDKRRKDGVSSMCKRCASIDSLKYYHVSKEYRRDIINKNRRDSHYKNKEKENLSCKKWKENNREYIREYNLNYNSENKSQNDIRNKLWRDKNKETIKNKRRKYFDYRLKNDELFKLKHYTRSMIRKSINSKGITTSEILGCSFEEFKIYLESKFEHWMNWDNRGLYNGELNYGWDIDHIIPLSSANTEEDIIKLNHYTNLQPLCSYVNRYIKKDKINL